MIDFEKRVDEVLAGDLRGHHVTLAAFWEHRRAILTQALRQLAADVLDEALAVRTWTEEERDGLAEAFLHAHETRGHYESLFAVGAWLLRHRRSKAAEFLKASSK